MLGISLGDLGGTSDSSPLPPDHRQMFGSVKRKVADRVRKRAMSETPRRDGLRRGCHEAARDCFCRDS